MTSRRQLYAFGEPIGDSATRKEGGRVIYGGGGGGGQSTTTTPTIPDELKPLANLYVQQASQIAQSPFQAYGGQRYADLNDTQNLGIGMAQNRALYGDQTINAGAGYLRETMGAGNSLDNPYGNVSAGANAYAGANPHIDQAVQRAQSSVVDSFNNMAKPQLETAMVGSGAFGNSGLQQQMQLQQKAAGQQMSDIASQMYMQDYQTQQGLAENALNRGMQAQQFNSQMGQDWFNSRQNAGLNAAQLGLNYGNQAYQDAGQLLNAGNVQQQQQQNNLDFGYSQFQDAQNYPFKQLQATGGVIGQNIGSTTTSSGGGK